MYGRRRVGKTALLNQFAKHHKVIFYSAQEKMTHLTYGIFQRQYRNFSENDIFLHFLGGRIVLIIDEFPFIAGTNPSVKSILQHIIDHEWQECNLFLILCGSSVSFLENEVLGYQSPLYGRRTSALEIEPFDYYDSARFFPNYSPTQQLLCYGILGGTPCYLKTFRDSDGMEENIAGQILETGLFLHDEPPKRDSFGPLAFATYKGEEIDFLVKSLKGTEKLYALEEKSGKSSVPTGRKALEDGKVGVLSDAERKYAGGRTDSIITIPIYLFPKFGFNL